MLVRQRDDISCCSLPAVAVASVNPKMKTFFFLLSSYRHGMRTVNDTSFCILKFIQVSGEKFSIINLIVFHRRFFTEIIETIYHNRFTKSHLFRV